MTIMIVTESYFGNTAAVAQAIAAGLARSARHLVVKIVHPADAPVSVPGDVSLLLVGAPTHAFSLPRAQTRKAAEEKGGLDAGHIGVREWIEKVVPPQEVHAVTFDTSIRTRFTPGSASKASSKALTKHGFRNVERGPSFFVTGTEGPLVDGERQRAEAWGAQLGSALDR